ncbi:hypothetical protein GM921_04505 [Pedobacter sp. LMG 31464]|uniref:Uncharacterized protein n=1 Tax=Pedobacter planticolens TaxID=2679964 RepID=A0A923DX84_9SPHI|nr:hypothetical protein [Pedobacter planticolens]MBB2144731.1 hypothetical protein [Pedobacter planticolens]
MKTTVALLLFLFHFAFVNAQELKLKAHKADALGGKAFANSIIDSNLSLVDRENIIYKEIKSGNIPDFLRKLKKVSYSSKINNQEYSIDFFVLPDYIAIGSNDDYMYMPMTPILAQRVANLLKCTLPTRKMVDLIYQNAIIKVEPQPIPPTKAMTTVPIFITHNELVKTQLIPYSTQHNNSELTAGNKKDVIISNKIYSEKTPKVVIYGWHKPDGKAIQPLYNKHTNTWADYSHGIRLIQNKIWVNGKRTTIAKVLADPILNQLLSDEGVIEKAYYPITEYK